MGIEELRRAGVRVKLSHYDMDLVEKASFGDVHRVDLIS